MTINVALVTYDAVVLGCDSLSSFVTPVVFPHDNNAEYLKDADGNDVRDDLGARFLKVKPTGVKQLAVDVLGGVSKMFPLYKDVDTTVGAVTAGLATIGGMSIAELAKRYRRDCESARKTFENVQNVATDFLSFIRSKWEADVGYDKIPEEFRQFLGTVQFLLGGFGKTDQFGRIFRLDVAKNSSDEQFGNNDHCGVCWAGAADYAERLLRGVDSKIQFAVSRQIVEALGANRKVVIDSVGKALGAAGVQVPEGLEVPVEEAQQPSLSWDEGRADIDYANLPLQYAVDFVSLLVATQSGMQRIGRGIPTVGGRTHIGVIQRGEELRMLNEPELAHKNVGYAHDL